MKTLKIYGPPGTGKTHRMLELFELELKHTAPDKIAFLTFTRAARLEALSRASLPPDDLPYVKTIHAICYRLLEMTQSRIIKPPDIRNFGKKIGVSITGLMHDPWSVESITGSLAQPTKADRLLQLNHLGRHRQIKLKEMMREAPLELDYHYAKWFTQSYRAWKDADGLLDYTDLLVQYLEAGPLLELEVIFVDEAQDLSPLQWAVVHKLGSSAQRRYLAGDDDQCQPAGEEVLVDYWGTTPRWCPIETLTDGDVVVPYISGAGFHTQKKIKVASRHYRGPMLTISVGGKATRCTPQHRWLVRWTKEAGNKYATYLMRRGDWFRVGTCKIRHDYGPSQTASGPALRLRIEKGDALWILKLHDSREAAMIYEAWCVVRYQISDMCFESGNTIKLHEFHQQAKLLANSTGCLADHGLLANSPLLASINIKTGPNTSFKTAAANIIPGMMTIPVLQPGSRSADHHVVSVTSAEFDGLVYSLDVDEYHTYCVNGLATCNSIFTWAGASPDIFNAEVADDTEVLPRSFRLPRSIQKVSEKIIARVKTRYPKDFEARDAAGVYRPIGHLVSEHLGDPDTFILFRNHYRGAQIAEILEGLNWPFAGTLSPLEQPYVRLALEAWGKIQDGHDMSPAEGKAALSVANPNLYANGALSRARTAKVGLRLIDVFNPNVRTMEFDKVFPRLPKLSYITNSLRHAGLKQLLDPPVTLMSIHQSKGRQANTVILDVEMAKLTWDHYLKSPDEEHRVFYVGVTRAKERLLTLLPDEAMSYTI